MSEESLYTEVARELMDELRDIRSDAKRAQQPKFMHENVKPSQLLERARTMTKGEREQLRHELGDDGVLNMLKGKGNG